MSRKLFKRIQQDVFCTCMGMFTNMKRLFVVFVLITLFICTVRPKIVATGVQDHEKFVEKVKEEHYHDGEHNADFDNDVLFGDYEDEIDKLSPEEKKEKLKSLVEKKIDANQDGVVTLEELTDWSVKSLDRFEMEEARAQFPETDVNKDGMIQWREYVDDFFGNDFSEESSEFTDPPSDEWKDFISSYNKDKKRFAASDLDNSEDLSLDEYLIFKHPRLHERTRELIIEEALQNSDTNQDGAIDLDEFLGDYRKTGNGNDPQWTIVEKDKFIHELDTDKNMKLEGEEIVNWMASDNLVLAREEAEHLMDESDTDGNKALDVEEIVENYGQWVESDATDYGQQLLQSHDEL